MNIFNTVLAFCFLSIIGVIKGQSLSQQLALLAQQRQLEAQGELIETRLENPLGLSLADRIRLAQQAQQIEARGELIEAQLENPQSFAALQALLAGSQTTTAAPTAAPTTTQASAATTAAPQLAQILSSLTSLAEQDLPEFLEPLRQQQLTAQLQALSSLNLPPLTQARLAEPLGELISEQENPLLLTALSPTLRSLVFASQQ